MEHENTVTTAADVMQRDVFTLTPELSLDDAVSELLRRGFSGAPVVDAHGVLLGVLSEKDCIEFLAAAAFHALPTGTVDEAMHHAVLTVSPEADLFRMTYLFHENPFRRLPVVDERGALLGMITRRDLLRALDSIRRGRKTRSETTYEAFARHRDRST
jgi:CBS domain-containing protein